MGGSVTETEGLFTQLGSALGWTQGCLTPLAVSLTAQHL